jgi:hypothetical protein
MLSYVVGRKYNLETCARAFCCRLQDFVPSANGDKKSPYTVLHPSLMTTAIKLDEGVYEEGAGADFS